MDIKRNSRDRNGKQNERNEWKKKSSDDIYINPSPTLYLIPFPQETPFPILNFYSFCATISMTSGGLEERLRAGLDDAI